jgi:hypothetical protein
MKEYLKSILKKADEKAEILFWIILSISLCDSFLKLGWLFYVKIAMFCFYLIIRLLNWRDNKAELVFWGIIAIVIMGIFMVTA